MYFYPGTFAKKHLQKLVLVLKMTIRHELEHSRQEINDITYSDRFDAQGVLDYFLDPSEIEAWVVALYKRAKMLKQPFFEVMHKVLEKQIYAWADSMNMDYKEADDIIEKVKDEWSAYAYERFPEAQ